MTVYNPIQFIEEFGQSTLEALMQNCTKKHFEVCEGTSNHACYSLSSAILKNSKDGQVRCVFQWSSEEDKDEEGNDGIVLIIEEFHIYDMDENIDAMLDKMNEMENVAKEHGLEARHFNETIGREIGES